MSIIDLTVLKGAPHCIDGGIKLLSSFVIKILCNICKGKISTFVVLEGKKARLSFPWFPVTLPLLEGVVSFKRGRIFQVEGWQVLFKAEMVMSGTDGGTPSLPSLKRFLWSMLALTHTESQHHGSWPRLTLGLLLTLSCMYH